MSEYKFSFSPIKSRKELYSAIEYLHISCHKLCKKVFGKYLLVAGNLGIFSHFDEEFEFLINLRQEITDDNKNWNKKYYFLHEPIIIPAINDIPSATYTYLYIRRPDKNKPEVGDIDFILNKQIFKKFKEVSVQNYIFNGVEIFYRPDLDMLKLSNPNYDVLPYITTTTMEQKDI